MKKKRRKKNKEISERERYKKKNKRGGEKGKVNVEKKNRIIGDEREKKEGRTSIWSSKGDFFYHHVPICIVTLVARALCCQFFLAPLTLHW